MQSIDRIKKHRDFAIITSKGVSWSCHFCIIKCFKNLDSNQVRVGFTASKKTIGNAVKRNFAKRRMRAAAIPALKEVGIPGHDYVIIARRSLLTCKFLQLAKFLIIGLKEVNKKL